MKYTVLFLGALTKDFNEVWGGTVATNYAFKKSFINHPKYNFKFIDRTTLMSGEDIKNAISNNPHDILHVDDTRVLGLMYDANIKTPDIIGPITRSPIKTYPKEWRSNYTEEYFYNAVVIRLNRSEEFVDDKDYTDKITFINHGIDTDKLLPSNEEKHYILWAGNINRAAKGYPMWEEIQKNIKLPEGYEYLTLSNYKVEDYWRILNNTKILINTSLNESFCCAMFEAKSKGVPAIYRKNLHNGRHDDCRIQVDYSVKEYEESIMNLLSDDEYYEKASRESRDYTVKHFSLQRMAETYSYAYDLALKKK